VREKGLKAAQDNGDNRFQPRGFTGSKQFGILRGTLQYSRFFSTIGLSEFVIGAMMQKVYPLPCRSSESKGRLQVTLTSLAN
jgi:hypothetical protein